MTAKKKAKKVTPKKKAPAKKRKVAPASAKPRQVARTSQELVIRVEQPPTIPTTKELAEPLQPSGSKMMIPMSWVNEKQTLQIMNQTPPKYIYKRKGRGGKVFDYVTGSYVEKVLNYVFGWNWDFEITNHGREGNQVWVQGRLTVKGSKVGQQITKMQFGRADIKFLKGSRDMVDYGNDLKAASTDALKKCASLLGIASDIYGKMDYTDESGQEPANDRGPQTPPPPPQNAPRGSQPPRMPQKQPIKAGGVIHMEPGQVLGPDGEPVHLCHDCSAIISDQVAAFSMRLFKKRLCLNCQRNNKK